MLTRTPGGAYNLRVLKDRPITTCGRGGIFLAPAALVLALAGGRGGLPWFEPKLAGGPPARTPVPEPLDQLLPRQVHIHAFTGTRVFSEHGGITGIDVRIQAKDAFDDTAKAFGKFRFELYHHKGEGPDKKGDRIAVWTQDVLDPGANRRHWDKYMKTYRFKLGWNQPIPVGRKFVLRVNFESPFTDRISDERVFVAGE